MGKFIRCNLRIKTCAGPGCECGSSAQLRLSDKWLKKSKKREKIPYPDTVFHKAGASRATVEDCATFFSFLEKSSHALPRLAYGQPSRGPIQTLAASPE